MISGAGFFLRDLPVERGGLGKSKLFAPILMGMTKSPGTNTTPLPSGPYPTERDAP